MALYQQGWGQYLAAHTPVSTRSPAPLLTQNLTESSLHTYTGDTSRDKSWAPNFLSLSLCDTRHHYTVRTTPSENDTGVVDNGTQGC